jgi:hypothetical protein
MICQYSMMGYSFLALPLRLLTSIAMDGTIADNSLPYGQLS